MAVFSSAGRAMWETDTARRACKVADIWAGYVSDYLNRKMPVLNDYSFAGYKYSSEPIPNVCGLLSLTLSFFLSESPWR